MLDFGGAVLDYDREYCLIHCVFFLSIDTCFPNDRSPVVYTCCRWTARADEGDTAVKVVFNLLPLKDFLLCTRLISDIWGVDASTNFCIGLCRM
jgi:hypothetical protein